MPHNRRKGDRLRAGERRERALELSLAGRSLRQIGAELGISHSRAGDFIREALAESAERRGELADKLRERELRRLERLIASLDPYREDPAAANTIIRAGERIAKLHGLDAPARLEHSLAGPDLSALSDEQLATLEAWLAGDAPEGVLELPPAPPPQGNGNGRNGHPPG